MLRLLSYVLMIAGIVSAGYGGVRFWFQRLHQGAKPDPQTIEMRVLLREGPGDNAYVEITGYQLSPWTEVGSLQFISITDGSSDETGVKYRAKVVTTDSKRARSAYPLSGIAGISQNETEEGKPILYISEYERPITNMETAGFMGFGLGGGVVGIILRRYRRGPSVASLAPATS